MYVCMYIYAESGTACSICNICSLAPRADLQHVKINDVWGTCWQKAIHSFSGTMLVYSKDLPEALQKLENRSLQINIFKMCLDFNGELDSHWIPQVCETEVTYKVTQ